MYTEESGSSYYAGHYVLSMCIEQCDWLMISDGYNMLLTLHSVSRKDTAVDS